MQLIINKVLNNHICEATGVTSVQGST